MPFFEMYTQSIHSIDLWVMGLGCQPDSDQRGGGRGIMGETRGKAIKEHV